MNIWVGVIEVKKNTKRTFKNIEIQYYAALKMGCDGMPISIHR
jgi:hypothetical protein